MLAKALKLDFHFLHRGGKKNYGAYMFNINAGETEAEIPLRFTGHSV